MRNYKRFGISLLIIFISVSSCKKIIRIDPPKTQLTIEKAFGDEQTATAVVSNIYAQFNSLDGNITPLLGMYSDELSTTSSDNNTLEFFNGNISVQNSGNLNIWRSLYSVIYQSNALIENISISQNLTEKFKQQILGEAFFLRSLSYFYLVNIYGDVPLILSTKVSLTSTKPRDSVAVIYNQITNDLLQAKANLPADYLSSGKVRANKWAAAALLSKVYLYVGKWQQAIQESSEIISSGDYDINVNINDVFLNDSQESILQFWTRDGYTTEGTLFIPGSNSAPTYPITKNLLNAFEKDDQRKAFWLDSVQVTEIYYYPFKYKNRSNLLINGEEYLSCLRLGEQYLIRAEAETQLNDINEGQADLNIIRNRAGLANTLASDKNSLLSAIEAEYRIEFFCEWGHRFFDLKRFGNINNVIPILKPQWKVTSVFLPIPQYERLNNPNLSQNPGY